MTTKVYNVKIIKNYKKYVDFRDNKISDLYEYFDTKLLNSDDIKCDKNIVIKKKTYKSNDIATTETNYEHLTKGINEILNKISPLSKRDLFDEVKKLKINDMKSLTILTKQVFSNAIHQDMFINVYRKLILYIYKNTYQYYDEDNKISNFRIILINMCQEEFQNIFFGNVKFVDKKRGDVDSYYKEKNKRKGVVRFIAELHNIKFIANKVLIYVLDSLIKKNDNSQIFLERIELIIYLLKNLQDKRFMNKYIKVLLEYKENEELDSRLGFFVEDMSPFPKKKKKIKKEKREKVKINKNLFTRSIKSSVEEYVNNEEMEDVEYYFEELEKKVKLNKKFFKKIYSEMMIEYYLGSKLEYDESILDILKYFLKKDYLDKTTLKLCIKEIKSNKEKLMDYPRAKQKIQKICEKLKIKQN